MLREQKGGWTNNLMRNMTSLTHLDVNSTGRAYHFVRGGGSRASNVAQYTLHTLGEYCPYLEVARIHSCYVSPFGMPWCPIATFAGFTLRGLGA